MLISRHQQNPSPEKLRLKGLMGALLLAMCATSTAWADDPQDASSESGQKSFAGLETDENCAKEDAAEGEAPGTQSESGSSEPTRKERFRQGFPLSGSLSCYVPHLMFDSSAQSVEADLADSDLRKKALIPYDPLKSNLNGYYGFRNYMQNTFGLSFTTDYNALYQVASTTLSGNDEAGSQVFRMLGTWLEFGQKGGTHGHLVWKGEYRGPYGSLPAPRDMGFDTGSALSTANFKELGWGVTDLYWRQYFKEESIAMNVGHMDPGDWADQYPNLNAWTLYLNDAFYNNPTESIPKRGFGIVGQAFTKRGLYFMAGVHDANGKDGRLDFDSFWNTRELMKWVEVGFRGSRNVSDGHNLHAHYWQQDAREEAGTSKSDGWAFTYSYVTEAGGRPFLRFGWSDGDAPQMRRFVGGGTTFPVAGGRDRVGVGLAWGSPPQKELRDQWTGEVFYRLQITQSWRVTPNLQVYKDPSFNAGEDWIAVVGLRTRISF